MHIRKPHFRPLPLVWKIAAFILIACLLLIGLAGLVLPIIPGILFLFLAFHVLTRVSRRAAAYAHSQPWLSRQLHRMQATDNLSLTERARLGLLVIARGMVSGLECVVSRFRQMFRD